MSLPIVTLPGLGAVHELLIVAFVLVFGDTMTRASGNAKVVNLASNLAAVALFASRGVILWKISLPMAAANAIHCGEDTNTIADNPSSIDRRRTSS